MSRKKFTLGDFIDAMEKNGYKQAFGNLFEYTNSWPRSIESACALGQANLNLGVERVDAHYSKRAMFSSFTTDVIYMNDTNQWSIQHIVDVVRRDYRNYLKMNLWGEERNYIIDPTAYITKEAS